MSDPTTTRLQEIQSELSSILEARLAELNHALRASEGTTRRIISAEIELERQRSTQAHYDEQIASTRAEVDDVRGKVQAARAEHEQISRQRDELRGELEGLERAVREADADAEKSRQRVATLSAEAETLRNENASLKNKLKTLEENIDRMRRLKEELMSSISGLTAQMAGLAGGGHE
jgi:chromosome segregation ATPase